MRRFTTSAVAEELEAALSVLAEDSDSVTGGGEVWTFMPSDRSGRRRQDDPAYVYVRRGDKTVSLTIQVVP